MKMQLKFFDHGAEDVSALVEAVQHISDIEWNAWGVRQKLGPGRNEPTIPFLYMPNFTEPTNYSKIDTYKQSEALEQLVLPLGRKMEAYFSGRCLKLMLVKITTDQTPFFHVDPSRTLSTVHRLHMPLVQSSQTRYHVGGEEFAMDVGHWYEKDNTLVHAVIDRAEPRQVRYSLQCDIFPEDTSRFTKFPGLYP